MHDVDAVALAYVNRRVGGLEVDAPPAVARGIVNRRVGGLEGYD